MAADQGDDTYKQLLALYRERGYKNPALLLNYDIEQLRTAGHSRAAAIRMLYRRETTQRRARNGAEVFAERRIKELEQELNELRASLRSRAEEAESIKKYLAYTHRLTTGQTVARVYFYLIGAVLVILSFFQYNALTVYIQVASGVAWVFLLDCVVTFSLGVSTIALGWVLESMARVRPVF
jgi:hypothetical protein